MSLAALERTLKALADGNRLRIIALLAEQKLCVCELANILRITQPSVSKHLKKLKQAGIIKSEQNGLWTDYGLSRSDHTTAALLKITQAVMKDDPIRQNDRTAAKKADRNRICCR